MDRKLRVERLVDVLVIVVGFGLSLYALIDCIRTEDDRVKGLPKIVWILLIVFVSYLGPIAWILAGRDRQWPVPGEQIPGVVEHWRRPDIQ